MILAITTDELSHAGYATAVATLQSAVWAGLQDAPDAYFDCFTPELKEEFQRALAREAEPARCGAASPGCSCSSGRAQIRGLRIYAEHVLSDTEVDLEYELDIVGGESRRCRQPLRRLGEGWKISGPPQEVR